MASVLLTGVAACGGEALAPSTSFSLPSTITSAVTTHPPSSQAATTSAAAADIPIAWDFSPSEALVSITLIEAGLEPHLLREYVLREDTAVDTSMRFGFSLVQVVGGATSIDLDSAVDIGLSVEVEDVVPEGYVVTSTYGDYRVHASDQATRSALQSVYAALSGTETTQLVAPNGQVLAVPADETLDEFTDLASALAGAAAPLPSEPIGVGASWEVVSEVEVQGLAFVQTSTITVVGIEGSVMDVVLEVAQVLGPEGLSLPGVDLTGESTLVTEGSGQAQWDLSRPIPLSAFTEAIQMLHVTGTVGGETTSLEQTTEVTFTLPSLASLAPPEGTEFFEIEDRFHSEDPISYEQDPPVGGNHAPTWLPCGFYDQPVASEQAVHSLEHGAVWITYQPDLPDEQVEVLRKLAEDESFVLVSPYPDLLAPVVASAWGRQLAIDSATDPDLQQFVSAFQQGPQTPEPGAPCTGGTSATQ